MKRLLAFLYAVAIGAAVAALLLPANSLAQTTGLSVRAIKQFDAALTSAGYFGFPRYATASLPTCNTANKGAIAFDTTVVDVVRCNGTAWATVGGASVGGSNVFTGANSFLDGTNFSIKNTADPTKIAQFSLASLSTSTTKTYTLPNNSGTVLVSGANIDVANNSSTATITNSFGGATMTLANSGTLTLGGVTGGASVLINTGVGAVASNRMLFQTNSTPKALTESSATAVVQIPIASGTRVGGAIEYTVDATDATDHQARAGRVYYQGVNKAGTETCVISGFDGTANPTELKDSSSPAVSLGTLTYTWGADTSPANGCNFTLNAVSSLTQTVLQITYSVTRNAGASGVITPQ